jgi:hypothetical protein
LRRARRALSAVALAALCACSKKPDLLLKTLVAEDAADANNPGLGPSEKKIREDKRLEAVLRLNSDGALQSAEQRFLAARILVHGHAPEHYRLAFELSKSAAKDGVVEARWLAANAEDRYRMSLDRPQLYGTQFELDPKTQKWSLYPVDPSITDDERSYWDVRPLAESRKLVGDLNREGLPAFSSRLRRERDEALTGSSTISTNSRPK